MDKNGIVLSHASSCGTAQRVQEGYPGKGIITMDSADFDLCGGAASPNQICGRVTGFPTPRHSRKVESPAFRCNAQMMVAMRCPEKLLRS